MEHCEATRIAHLLHLCVESTDRPSIRQILNAMKRHDMATTGLEAVLEVNLVHFYNLLTNI